MARHMWTLLQTACLLGLLSAEWPGLSDEEITPDLRYPYNYFGEFGEEQTEEETPTQSPEETPMLTPEPCKASAFTEWDKLFTMLENSQMKENMLLQYADDIIKVELQSLRGEMLQFVAQYGDSCASAIDKAARRSGAQMETRLENALTRLREVSADQYEQQELVLQQLLASSVTQDAHLERLENCCLKSSQAKSLQARHLTQEVTDGESGVRLEKTLASISSELQAMREQMTRYMRSNLSNRLPSGCDTGLLFPTRSSTSNVEVTPKRPFPTKAVTICLWAKPTQVLNKTVLFSYSTTGNPYELELVLNGQSVQFTVDGETHLVEAPGVVQEGQWVHLCAVWSSWQGLASVWVNGQQAASSPGVAEGHELRSKGSLLLGQEYGRYFRHLIIPETFNAELAFTGKMTGVNMWDRVLDSQEISQQAQLDGSGCGNRGNVVAWGVSDIESKGGVKLIY
ncbi:pentraxin-related protein PTX3 isoform X2 [Triplophysa rosa]|uniref:pentraxin-related protein PTX3 isoform X2 n=1 Tax=Triplophysa rosa TaxID=992332 RepID=UPI00254601CD|nr:pentraxin-related protein PTX3 isoform X2 [Triplophysa rosa]